MEMISDKYKKGLAIGLFLSGLSSLSFECLWFRKLGLLLGSSHLASVYLLSMLMLGFALGAYLAPIFLQKYPYPLRLYGALELFIGLYGGFSAYVLDIFPFYSYYHGRFFFGALMILPPSLAMGATLPLLCDSLFAHNPKMSGRYYGLNTLGAVFGVWGCGFYFLPLLGMRGSFVLASSMCVVVGILFFTLGRSVRVEFVLPPKEPFLWGPCLFYFTLGFIGLAYQTFWTRTLILVLGSSVYAFSIVLLTFLLATAIGSLVASFYTFQKTRALGFLQVFGALFGFISILYLSHLPDLFFRYFNFFGPRWIYLGQFVFCFFLMAPTCFLLGATFPAIVALTPSHKKVSRLYMANTLGGAFAPFFLGLLLMFVLSIHQALLATVCLQLFLGLLFLSWTSRLASILGAFVLLGLLGLPQWDPASMTSANYLYVQVRQSREQYLSSWEQLDYKEGVSAIVTVDQKKNQSDFTKVLRINGKEASGYADLPTEILLAHLPFAFHPNPRTALVIGLGGGITVGSTMLSSRLQEVYCAELIPEVFEMEPYFHEINHRPLQQKELISVPEDGRIYLAGQKKSFDLIISQPSNPWISGASALFTEDFYALGRERLSEQGVFCQWMQTYEISWTSLGTALKAFQTVFPYCYVYHPRKRADILLIGLKQPLTFHPQRLFENKAVSRDLRRAQIENEADLINNFLLLPQGLSKKLAPFQSNTDNNGYIEFRTPYELFTSSYLENNYQLHLRRSSLLSFKSERLSWEELSENAFTHQELELSAYWALLALKENSTHIWARTRLNSLIQVSRIRKLPEEWQKEVGVLLESLCLQQEAEDTFSKGKLSETLTLLRQAVSLWVENQEAHLRLGMLFDAFYHQDARIEHLESALMHLQMVRALGGETPTVLEKGKTICRKLIFSAYNEQSWEIVLKYIGEYKAFHGSLSEDIQHCLAEALRASVILAFQKKEWKQVIDWVKQYEEEIGKPSESILLLYQESLKNWLR